MNSDDGLTTIRIDDDGKVVDVKLPSGKVLTAPNHDLSREAMKGINLEVYVPFAFIRYSDYKTNARMRCIKMPSCGCYGG